MHNFKKLALSFSDLTPGQQRAAFAAAMGLTGGVLGGGLNYAFTSPRQLRDLYPEAHPSELQRLRKRQALITGLGVGLSVGAHTYLNTSDSPGESHGSAPRARPEPTASSWDDGYNTQLHGDKLKRVYDTVTRSSEVADPQRAAAFSSFMKSVGTPGANVEDLRRHMDNFPQDTAARQFMNILMNKHHAKQAYYVPPRRLKTASLVALYRAISGRR